MKIALGKDPFSKGQNGSPLKLIRLPAFLSQSYL